MHIIESKYEDSIKLLTDNREKLEVVAAALMEREKLSGEEFEILFAGGSLSPIGEETVSESNVAEETVIAEEFRPVPTFEENASTEENNQ
jgi:cell division protease FtsH